MESKVRGPLPKDMNLSKHFSELENKDGSYNKWMMSAISKNDLAGIRAWQATIRLLGSVIHYPSGTSLLNSILTVAEKGFKCENMTIRCETFAAWKVLIDNFALNDEILLQPKRIKLISRPLVVSTKE